MPAEGVGGLLMNALPLLGSLGSVGLVVTMGGGSGGRAYLAAGLFLATTLGFVVVQVDRQRTLRGQRVGDVRAGYLHHLAGVRADVRDAAERQRRALGRRHPEPAALPALAAERSRLWARTVDDDAFLQVRYAVGEQPLGLELCPAADDDPERADPVAVTAQQRLLAVHRTQADLPLVLDLRGVHRLELCGPPAAVRCLARAVVCSAVVGHSPGQLAVAVLCTGPARAEWEWVKWLPHARSDRAHDALGRRRMVATSPEELAALLPADLRPSPSGASGLPPAPHLLLVVDARPPTGHRPWLAPGPGGVTVLVPAAPEDGPPGPGAVRLRLDEEPAADGRHPLRALRAGEPPVPGRADRCDAATAEAMARRLAPLADTAHPPGPTYDGGPGLRCVVEPAELLGLGDVHALDPATAWRPRPSRDRLRVPIGVDPGGDPVHLDLKESAEQGMGPHGLVVGATGSGKSELLRTLVLALATSHSPEELNLVLVDFKGGATFAGMAGLPHVSALITNLEEELTLVDRMEDALAGELVRRQALLRRAGNLASVREHRRARRAGAAFPALPALVVVVDEFSELLAARPEFVRLFETIGRLGRSLGVHLVLASQRLEEGRLRGLEAHLSYRIGLRTFSAAESRSALGVPDAHALPAVPGAGLLRTGGPSLVRFTAAHVSGPATVPRPRTLPPARFILPFTAAGVRGPEAPEPGPGPVDGPSLLDVAVGRLAGHGPRAHRVWLPPLDVPDTLDALMDDLVVDPRLGLVSPRWRGLPGLVVPLGAVDRPRDQRRDPLGVDLAGAGGHVAVVGGPRSGKSTLLRTLVAGLALTATPHEAQVFVLDLGGGGLAAMAGLPHVAGVGTRTEPDVVRRVLAEVCGVLDRREASFRARGIDSVEAWRARRATDGPGHAPGPGGPEAREPDPDGGYGDVFVVVDGWGTLRAELDEVEAELQRLAGRGLALGVHLVAATSRWADFRTATRDLFGTRFELRLGDPADSEIDRRAAARVPAGRPGRGLVTGGWHVLTGLPRIDGEPAAGTLATGLDDLVRRVADAWPGPPAPRLRLLPARVDLTEVRAGHAPAAGDRRLLLGLREDRLSAATLDPDAEPHLLVLGAGGSGRSGTLRTYLREVVRTRTPSQAAVVLVDPRRSLLGEVPDPYLHDHLGSAPRAGTALADLAASLGTRLPGPDVTPAQLRQRSWWSGPEVFVVVDDHDLLTTGRVSPVEVLVPLLAQARDIGLHLVVARRSGGATRDWHEPVLSALRDLAAPALLLAGSPEEGPLVGGLRPGPAPPGRGRLVTRDRGVEVVQVAWCEREA
jgi:S-DNA-T family DNA segregation ATPase FtsK/SpoIIIE